MDLQVDEYGAALRTEARRKAEADVSGMFHHHDHGPADAASGVKAGFGRAFVIGIALNTVFVVFEAGAGWYSDSMALLADAGHNLSDVLALLLAWGATMLAARRPSAHYTYGLRSTTIFAALANAALLLVAVGAIGWEAIGRLIAPVTVKSEVVIGVALAGVLINGATAMLFMAGRRGDLNIRGAFLHMATDTLVSLGVALAGVGMMFAGWLWLDPAISIAVVAGMAYSIWDLLRDGARLALHAVPPSIDPEAVRGYLCGQSGVAEVHDLHIWAMSTTDNALSAHLVMPGGHPGDAFIAGVAHELDHRYGIGHATLQIELGAPEHPCALAPEHVV